MAPQGSDTLGTPEPSAVLALIPLAQVQLRAQLDDADTASNRALAEIGVAGALLATLCGARLADPALLAWWFVPLLGFGLSGVFLGMVLRPVQFDTGRTPRDAYRLVAGLNELEGYHQILAMLQEALQFNEPRLREKFRWLRWGERTLIATLILGPLALWLLQAVPFI